jgi:hypothetical protein
MPDRDRGKRASAELRLEPPGPRPPLLRGRIVERALDTQKLAARVELP